jgi:hypothetical protein
MSSLGTNYSKDEMNGVTNVNSNPNQLNLTNNIHSSNQSGVSWSAVLAGTAVATALILILIILGVGFGMSSISVWSGQGITAEALGFTAIIWLIFTQIIAYGMGGFLAGRLRVKWVLVHNDEVYFRDTAHGFLTWALASLICATLLTSVIGKIVGGSANEGANLVSGASTATIAAAGYNLDSGKSSVSNPLQYMVSTLFRKDNLGTTTAGSTDSIANTSPGDNNATGKLSQNSSNAGQANPAAEVLSIIENNMSASTLPTIDIKYAGQLISQQTGLSQAEAESRVAMTFKTLQEKKANAMQETKETAEKARKTAANTALWFFALLLIGAFSASLAATWGGKCRDN